MHSKYPSNYERPCWKQTKTKLKLLQLKGTENANRNSWGQIRFGVTPKGENNKMYIKDTTQERKSKFALLFGV